MSPAVCLVACHGAQDVLDLPVNYLIDSLQALLHLYLRVHVSLVDSLKLLLKQGHGIRLNRSTVPYKDDEHDDLAEEPAHLLRGGKYV